MGMQEAQNRVINESRARAAARTAHTAASGSEGFGDLSESLKYFSRMALTWGLQMYCAAPWTQQHTLPSFVEK